MIVFKLQRNLKIPSDRRFIEKRVCSEYSERDVVDPFEN